jgi:hypothetical protein
MSDVKKTPIPQTQWDILKEQGINPEEMGFRIKGTRGEKNINFAPVETQETYREMETLARDCDSFVRDGIEYVVGVYCHKVPVKK